MQPSSTNKKLTRKEKQAAQQQQPSRKQQQQQQIEVQKTRRWLGIIIAAIAMLVYANTIGHQYVLDDWGLIPENKSTRKGFDGIGEIFSTSYRTGMDISDNSLYRPLSKATFAVEWELFPNNPMPGHITNILLYGLTCFLLFNLLTRLFKGRWLEPFIAALLFAVHPIHTEVVANIKSRDEIMSLLFLFCAAFSALSYAESGRFSSLLKLSGCFFLAVLAKESAITWIAVLPLILYFFTSASRKSYIPVVAAAVVPTLLFLLIRASILTGTTAPAAVVDNYLNGIDDFLTQRTTAIALNGIYLFKLFVPYALFSDASFDHFPPFPISDWRFLLSAVAFISLAAFAIKKFRSKDPISFSIIYFFVSLSIVSNVLVLIGTNYAERLLFSPSIGWCIAIAVLAGRLLPVGDSDNSSVPLFLKNNLKPLVLTGVIGLVFATLSLARNADWKDNYTLYKADLKKVSRSAHMRFYLANHITSEEFLLEHTDAEQDAFRKEAIAQLDTAISIYPEYSDAYQRRAFIQFDIAKRQAVVVDSLRKNALDSLAAVMLTPKSASKDSVAYYREAQRIAAEYDTLRSRLFTEKSEPDFITSLKFNPSQSVAHNNYGNLLFETRRFMEARTQFEQAIRYNGRYAHAYNNLASIYGVLGDNERSLAGSDVANSTRHLTNAKQNYETALTYFRKAIEQDPEYYMPWYLMGITYRNLGDEKMARDCFNKSDEVKKTKRYNAYN